MTKTKHRWGASARLRRKAASADAFEAKIDKSAGADGCWLWRGGIHAAVGYGYFGKPKMLAHRIAFESADMVAKGRQPRFVGAKLTHEKAVEARRLRAEGLTMKAIGIRFGVTVGTISALLSGRTWK